MRWLKKDTVIKFSVLIVVFITIIVSMNAIEMLDKYVDKSKDNIIRKSGYSYEEDKSLYYTKKVPDSTLKLDYELYKNEIRKDVEKFFEKLPDFKGNVTFPLIDISINNGMYVSSNIIISFNEELPYIIDREGCADSGIYIGNVFDGYWTDGKVLIEYDMFDVAGVLCSEYLELCTDVYIPYEYLSVESRNVIITYIVTQIYLWGGELPICFSSDKQGVVESDIKLMDEWNQESGIFTLCDISDDSLEAVEAVKADTFGTYKYIKNVLCIISFAFCIAAVFETIRLYISRKKKDIMILWSLGSKKSVILKMILNELGLAVIIGAVLAFAAEWIIYGMIMGFRFASVVMYGVYALITVILITVIMIMVMLLFTLRKPVITVIKSGE